MRASALAPGSCTVQQSGAIYQEHLDVTASGGKGGPAHLIADRVFDLSIQPFKSLTETGLIEIGNSVVYSYAATLSSDQSLHLVVDWGPHVQGAKHAVFDIQNDTVSGSIDGRAFVPFAMGTDLTTVKFVDGGPSPVLKSAPPLADSLARLSEAVATALPSCTQAPSPTGPAGGPTTDWQPGHLSATYDAGGCVGCKIGSGLLLGALGGAAAGFCCVGTLGLACGVCAGGAVVATASAIFGCETSTLCCPVNCEPGTVAACCFGGETCLDPASGSCCSEGYTACGGKECCGSDESCISVGPNKGTCCKDGQVCGETCCASGTFCADAGFQGLGKCCANGTQYCPGVHASCTDPNTEVCQPDGTSCPKPSVCGSQCCDQTSQCVFGTAGPFCCSAVNSSPCGSSCCPGVGTCINGACCDPNRTCGSKCCDNGQICVNGDCQADTVQCSSPYNKCEEWGYLPTCCLSGTACAQGQCCAPGEFRDSCGQCATVDCVH